MKILVGADPEVFVKRDGQHVSAHGLVNGTKEQPQIVSNGAVQVDGLALEFNIDPVDNCDKFLYNIKDVLQTLKSMVPEYELDATPVAHFTKEYLKTQPPEATELGCSPDLNAWTGEPNQPPDSSKLFRTGAGHIHVGWTRNAQVASPRHKSIASSIARQMDFYVGLPSLMYDDDGMRRELYGRAGAYRPKPYGLEYRVLSNAWLNTNKLIRLVYNNTIEAVTSIKGGNILTEKYGDIQSVINSSDKDAAVRIMNEEGISYEV